ncbi:MAG: divergent polysaccharide deacetylase family protein [Methylobacteriaceae bacterium]|nr:divergent polysaccharide deacetylase family protein [Methylobacteriaceae bacterium]
MDRPEPKPRRIGLGAAARFVAAASGGVLLLAIGYAAVFGDPHGGVPRVAAPIGVKTEPPPAAPDPSASAASAAGDNGRRDAALVETASGVSVLRPAGTSAPGSVIVRVPDAPSASLRPAPDPRLAELSRFGILPRVAPDGARPLEVYARPPVGFANGTRPIGRVAIVVGGLGISPTASQEAISKLPAPVTLAVAPYGAELEKLAARAREDGHELMLQVPMEPFDYPDSDPGPHTLRAAARPAENIEHLQWAMSRFAGYVAVMNYMGGKVTADEKALAPILKEVGGRGIGFLDDGSSARSVVTNAAGTTRAARADLVLDAVPRADLIDKALEKLEASAAAGGFALGVASALPVSVERIARWAAGLEKRGILLVPASQAFQPRSAEMGAR